MVYRVYCGKGCWGYGRKHLSGYDGGFTPGHLWFILFLFLISLFSVVLFHFLPYGKAAGRLEKLLILGVVFLFVPVWLMYYLGNFGGLRDLRNILIVLLIRYIFCTSLFWWLWRIMLWSFVI